MIRFYEDADRDYVEDGAMALSWRDVVPQAAPAAPVAATAPAPAPAPAAPAAAPAASTGSPDWGSVLNWGGAYNFALPSEAQIARSQVSWEDYYGNVNKFAPSAQNVELLRKLGFSGNALDDSYFTPESMGGDKPKQWSHDALTWLSNQGYQLGVGHVPGTKSGGRAEYFGLIDSSGKFVSGQSDPTMGVSDTMMDMLTPFLLMAGPLAAGAGVGSTTIGAVGGGLSGAANAHDTGGSILKGALTGALKGGIGAWAGSQLGEWVNGGSAIPTEVDPLSVTMPTPAELGVSHVVQDPAIVDALRELSGLPALGAAVPTATLPTVAVTGAAAAAPSLGGALGGLAGAAAAIPAQPQIDPKGLSEVLDRVTVEGSSSGGDKGATSLPPLGTTLTPAPEAPQPQTPQPATQPSGGQSQGAAEQEQLDRVVVEGQASKPEAAPVVSLPGWESFTPELPDTKPLTPEPATTLDRVVIEGKATKPEENPGVVPPVTLPDFMPSNPLPSDWYDKVLDRELTPVEEPGKMTGGTKPDTGLDWKDILKGVGTAIGGSSGSVAGGLIKDLAGIGFGNYLYQGAQRDSAEAKKDYDENVAWFKDQAGRLGEMTDFASGAFKDALGKLYDGVFTGTFNPGEYKPITSDANWQDNNMVKAFMSAAGGSAAGRLGADYSAARAKADGALADYNAAQAGVAAAIDGMGPRRKFGDADVNTLSEKFYGLRSGALDRALALASSQGFASAASRGLADSTQAGDTRDEVVRRFADKYGELQASSITDALRQVQGYQDLEDRFRAGVISDATAKFDPKTRAQVAQMLTGSADNLASVWANADNAQASRNLQALQLAEGLNQQAYQRQYDAAKVNWDGQVEASRQRNQLASNALGTISSVLNSSMLNGTNAAMRLMETSGQNYQALKKGEGQALEALINALNGSKTVGAVTDAAGRILDKAGNVIGQKVGDVIVDAAGNIIDGAADWLGDAADWFKGFFGD